MLLSKISPKRWKMQFEAKKLPVYRKKKFSFPDDSSSFVKVMFLCSLFILSNNGVLCDSGKYQEDIINKTTIK